MVPKRPRVLAKETCNTGKRNLLWYQRELECWQKRPRVLVTKKETCSTDKKEEKRETCSTEKKREKKRDL